MAGEPERLRVPTAGAWPEMVTTTNTDKGIWMWKVRDHVHVFRPHTHRPKGHPRLGQQYVNSWGSRFSVWMKR